MMCLSDANEWFLRSSVSPPLLPFHSLSPSGFFICQKAIRKSFFSPLVMKLPHRSSEREKSRIFFFSSGNIIYWRFYMTRQLLLARSRASRQEIAITIPRLVNWICHRNHPPPHRSKKEGLWQIFCLYFFQADWLYMKTVAKNQIVLAYPQEVSKLAAKCSC